MLYRVRVSVRVRVARGVQVRVRVRVRVALDHLLEEVVQVGAAVRDGLALGVDRPEVVGEAALLMARVRGQG